MIRICDNVDVNLLREIHTPRGTMRDESRQELDTSTRFLIEVRYNP